MDIALLNTKIIIQQNTLVIDACKNHTNTWSDYYTCHATLSGEAKSANGNEENAAGQTIDHAYVDFTIRYCIATMNLTTDDYRVKFNNEYYDILSIDHMNNKHKSIKLHTRKVKR